MKFQKSNIHQIRKDFKAAVAEFEKNYGVKVDLGNIRYTSSQITSKVTITVEQEGVESEVVALKTSFDQYASRYGLKSDDWGRTMIVADTKMYLIGVNTRNSKYPIIAATDDKKRYKLSVDQCKDGMLRGKGEKLNDLGFFD